MRMSKEKQRKTDLAFFPSQKLLGKSAGTPGKPNIQYYTSISGLNTCGLLLTAKKIPFKRKKRKGWRFSTKGLSKVSTEIRVQVRMEKNREHSTFPSFI